MFKLGLEKAGESENKLPTSVGSMKKQESSRKTSTSLLTTPKPLTVWITTNCGKFLKKWEPAPVFLPGEAHGQREPRGLQPMVPEESCVYMDLCIQGV